MAAWPRWICAEDGVHCAEELLTETTVSSHANEYIAGDLPHRSAPCKPSEGTCRHGLRTHATGASSTAASGSFDMERLDPDSHARLLESSG